MTICVNVNCIVIFLRVFAGDGDDDAGTGYSTNVDVAFKLGTRTEGRVDGVALLDSRVCILRRCLKEVERYDVDTYAKQSSLQIAGLVDPCDMTSCETDKCLYICGGDDKRVLRVELNGKAVSWLVNGNPSSLSVTGSSSVVVDFYSQARLIEFTPGGQIVREIDLQQPAVAKPRHAVRLASGQFLVSLEGVDHRVCTVGVDGSGARFYGDRPGSAAGQVNRPGHLVVDGRGFILVADCDNDRVLLLSPSLTCVGELVAPGGGLQQPRRLCLDETRGLLYVGDSRDGRLSVFKVKNILLSVPDVSDES